jgi:hypothetical protein
LNQLRRNARTASRRFAELAQQESMLAPRIVVRHLDWPAVTHCFDLCCIDLAIGSELVYTILLIRHRAASKLCKSYCVATLTFSLSLCKLPTVVVGMTRSYRWSNRSIVPTWNAPIYPRRYINTPPYTRALYQYVEQSGTVNAVRTGLEVCLISKKNEEGSSAQRQCL